MHFHIEDLERPKYNTTPRQTMMMWADHALGIVRAEFPRVLTDVRTKQPIPWPDVNVLGLDAYTVLFLVSPEGDTVRVNNDSASNQVGYTVLHNQDPVTAGLVTIDDYGMVRMQDHIIQSGLSVVDTSDSGSGRTQNMLAYKQLDGQRINSLNCPLYPCALYAVVLAGAEIKDGPSTFVFIR